ncbi:hypothetical protein AAVH_28359 [Aphelenchoides avenae]|nr:hypothetical protein AAVH_28359 [Aphelenchus avenae]
MKLMDSLRDMFLGDEHTSLYSSVGFRTTSLLESILTELVDNTSSDAKRLAAAYAEAARRYTIR